ncbi:MAG: hypothetical protein ACRD1H_06290 [Vicinamibacterales bacterium]
MTTRQKRRLPLPEDIDVCAIIEQYVEQSPHELGRENARLKGHGVSVVAIVTALLYHGGDLYGVADAYELPEEAVRAAIWYYGNNKQVIDARLLLNWAIDDPVGDPCARET